MRGNIGKLIPIDENTDIKDFFTLISKDAPDSQSSPADYEKQNDSGTIYEFDANGNLNISEFLTNVMKHKNTDNICIKFCTDKNIEFDSNCKYIVPLSLEMIVLSNDRSGYSVIIGSMGFVSHKKDMGKDNPLIFGDGINKIYLKYKKADLKMNNLLQSTIQISDIVKSYMNTLCPENITSDELSMKHVDLQVFSTLSNRIDYKNDLASQIIQLIKCSYNEKKTESLCSLAWTYVYKKLWKMFEKDRFMIISDAVVEEILLTMPVQLREYTPKRKDTYERQLRAIKKNYHDHLKDTYNIIEFERVLS